MKQSNRKIIINIILTEHVKEDKKTVKGVKNCKIFQIFFAQINSNFVLGSFLKCLRQFSILKQTDRFTMANSMQDGQFSKSSFFSNICCFLKVFFEHNNGNVAVESFFASSGQFHFFKDYALIFPKAHSLCKIVPKPNIREMRAF